MRPYVASIAVLIVSFCAAHAKDDRPAAFPSGGYDFKPMPPVFAAPPKYSDPAPLFDAEKTKRDLNDYTDKVLQRGQYAPETKFEDPYKYESPPDYSFGQGADPAPAEPPKAKSGAAKARAAAKTAPAEAPKPGGIPMRRGAPRRIRTAANASR
jgi:hypothetical protein